MTTFNVVRFRVKPGQDEAFLDAHRAGKADWPGLVRGVMLRTGERSYCLVGEWADAHALANARAQDDRHARQFPRHAGGSWRRDGRDGCGVGACRA